MKTLHAATLVLPTLLALMGSSGPAQAQPANGLAPASAPALDGAALTEADGPATDEVSIEYLLETLAPYGDWIMSREHGWVWRPAELPDEWQPFTRGEWAYTEYGWTWSSDFAWGWAPFHYGNWTTMDRFGWVWIPDTVWYPARVQWRYSDGYVGWAPIVYGYDGYVGWAFNPLPLVFWSFLEWGHFLFHLHDHHDHHHHHHRECWDLGVRGCAMTPDQRAAAYSDSEYPPGCSEQLGVDCRRGPDRGKVMELAGERVPVFLTKNLAPAGAPTSKLGRSGNQLEIFRPRARRTVKSRSTADAPKLRLESSLFAGPPKRIPIPTTERAVPRNTSQPKKNHDRSWSLFGSSKSSTPSRSYSKPSRSRSAPSRSYSRPSRSKSAPSRSYSKPSRSKSAPSRSYSRSPSRSKPASSSSKNSKSRSSSKRKKR